MTRDKDTSQGDWEESREAESYRIRPRPQSQQRPPSQRRPVPPRDDRDQMTEPPVQRRRQTRDFREEDTTTYQQPQRPRITRQSREDTYARLRRRPLAGGRDTPGRDKSRPYTARDEMEDSPGRTPPRRITNPEEEMEDSPGRDKPGPYTQRRITNTEQEPYVRHARRAGTRVTPATPRRAQPQRRRSWPTLLLGCIGGILIVALIAAIALYLLIHNIAGNVFPGLGIGGSTYSDQQRSVTLSIPSTITQVQINNSVGNMSVSVDTTNTSGTTATLSYTKKVQASSSSNATTEFGRISVNTGNGTTASCPQASCLSISTTIPNATQDSVDLILVLPANVNRLPSTVTNTPPFTLNANTTVKGDITVQNFEGAVNLRASKQGNVSMQHGLLVAGSCLVTNIGNVTFNALLDVSFSSSLVPCTTSTSTDPHAWYEFKSEGGNVDATLNPSLNIIIDANTNFGKLNSDFPLTPASTLIPYCGTSPPTSTYFCGPLVAGSTLPSAILKLDVSTGNINIHKGASS